MDESIPSISTSGVGSRFVSQNEIESAKERREQQWKAAYARLGQEPPTRPVEDFSDGRSLAEKLAANRAAKQEEWEERNKLANQFRALEEDEIMFLDSIREKQAEEERLRELQDGQELQDFKKAVAARENAVNNPPPPAQNVSKSAPKDSDKGKALAQNVKKDVKKSLKGVLVKKKAQPAPSPATSAKKSSAPAHGSTKDDDEQPGAKRRKLSESS